jgi:dTMP kinase
VVPAYIAFEGGEGSGKSTQAARLAERIGATLTREPGGTDLGVRLRELLLGSGDWTVSPRAEALLMAADRAQHLHEVVLPALAQGIHVVSDRTAYSSLAYQGAGRELGIDAVRGINEWALYGRWPDIVVYLRVDRAVATERLTGAPDRLEQESELFHRRVGAAFDRLAEEDPKRWLVINGAGTPEEIEQRIWATVEPLLG